MVSLQLKVSMFKILIFVKCIIPCSKTLCVIQCCEDIQLQEPLVWELLCRCYLEKWLESTAYFILSFSGSGIKKISIPFIYGGNNTVKRKLSKPALYNHAMIKVNWRKLGEELLTGTWLSQGQLHLCGVPPQLHRWFREAVWPSPVSS